MAELKKNATPLKAIKFITGTLISCGAMAAVAALLKGSLKGSKGVTKLLMRLGIFVLACKAGEVAEDYFSETFDETVEAFKETQEELKNESDTNEQ